MGKKNKFDYFDAMDRIVGYALEEAEQLQDILNNFDPDKVFDQMNDMHKIEDAADLVNHEIYDSLAKEFITPIDRDDIVNLSELLDDIVDSIEDVMMHIYMYDIKDVHPSAFDMVSLIEKSVNALKVAMVDFRNFKKSDSIKSLLVDVSDFEEAADKKYVMAIRRLHAMHPDSSMYVMTWENLISKMEKCCDACASCGDAMSQVIMKNS